MKFKKAVLILLISLLCFAGFADDAYNLKVESAEDMSVSDSVVTLEGNVVLTFETDGKQRSLNADRVIINLDNKELNALGNVYLNEDKDSTFRGNSLSMNWESLDIVVFGGTSNSERSGKQGNAVNFFIVGDRISYSGKNDAVFFRDGIISTRESDPYWSVKAKKIGLAGSDIFFSNATLKIGRVPIFWLPVFFYPGNRLSFNPAIGFSSSKGAFFNTTYEIYGSYPKLGSSKSYSDDLDDAEALASNFLSLLETKSNSKKIRRAWTYVDYDKDEELSPLQKWALDTGSYFAVFGDAWENFGLSIGYDTKNYFFNKKLTVSSIGVLAYKTDKFRYYLDINGDYSNKGLKLSFKMPVSSDPEVRSDLLNRNTVFGLDAAFGSKQSFPKTYSSSLTSYSTYLDGSYRISGEKLQFNISSLKSQINYKWDTEAKKYKIEDATLPYISLNISGDILEKYGEPVTKQEETKLSNRKAKTFLVKYEDVKDSEGVDFSDNYNEYIELTSYVGKDIPPYKDVTSDSEYITTDFSINQIIDNKYTDEFDHLSFYTKVDAEINTKALTKNNWVKFSDSIKPVLSATSDKKEKNTNLKVQNVTALNVPKIGLSYNLSNNIYIYDKTAETLTKRVGRFDKTDVLEHSLGLSNTTGNFTYGLKYILPPLDQVLTPSVAYNDGTFSSSSDISFSLKKGSHFKPTKGNLSFSFKNNGYYFNINASNDFTVSEAWNGFKANQSMSYTLLGDSLKLSENLSLVNNFEIKSLSFTAAYNRNRVKLSFKDKNIALDILDIYLCQDFNPVYYWKSRIGFEGSADFGFVYDFKNKYNAYLYTDLDLSFAVNKFLDLSVSVKSVNNGFYRYYDDFDKFSFGLMTKDLLKSFDFFNKGRYSTGFNLSSFRLSAIHYLEDWKLTLTSSSSIKTVDGKNVFVPEFSFLVQWNAIPELKTTNTWNKTSGWEK